MSTPSFPALSRHTLSVFAFFQRRAKRQFTAKSSTSARHPGTRIVSTLGGVDLVELNSHSHTIELLLSQSFMREITEDLGVSAVTHLGNDACFIRPDPVIPRMVQHMRPFFDDPGSLETLQADSFMWAFAIYVMRRYGELESHRPRKGGLTTWQERLAKDWIEAVLPGGTTLSELATACGIGVSHFAHAFRRTTGVSPYQWLVQRRVERVKELLKFSLPLSDIALTCGFSDQSHMTRTFKRATGLAPRTWQLTQQIRVSDSS